MSKFCREMEGEERYKFQTSPLLLSLVYALLSLSLSPWHMFSPSLSLCIYIIWEKRVRKWFFHKIHISSCHSVLSRDNPMGLSISVLKKFGLTGIQSLSADKVFDRYFPAKEIESFEKFHIKFLQFWNDFNSIMLGKHYFPPCDEDIKKCFQGWSGKANSEERKKLVLDLLNAHVKVIKTDDLIVMTGLVAPLAAMGLKKSSQHVPQIKRIRLDLVPDIIFVPTFAVATLFFVKIVQLKKGPVSE